MRALVFILVIAGCAGSDSATPTARPSDTPTRPSGTPVAPSTFPYRFADGLLVKILGGAQYRGLPEEPAPAPGMRHLAVTIWIENPPSSPAARFTLQDFALEDMRGMRRPAAFRISEDNRFDSRDIREAPPGVPVSWAWVFEAPQGDADLQVHYRGVRSAIHVPAEPRCPPSVVTPGRIVGTAPWSGATDVAYAIRVGTDGCPYFTTRLRGAPMQPQIEQTPSNFVIEGVEPGTYVVVTYSFSWVPFPGHGPLGGWTRASVCGLLPTCTDHGLLEVVVRAGETTERVYTNDRDVTTPLP